MSTEAEQPASPEQTPLDKLDPNADCFEWMIPASDDPDMHPLEAAVRLRAAIEEMAETKATFKFRHLLNPRPSGIKNSGWTAIQPRIPEEIALVAGSWPVPNTYTASKHHGKGEGAYVNPNYAHVHKYPGVAVMCECGTPMVQINPDGVDTHRKAETHADECTVQNRLRARAEIVDARVDLARTAIRLGWEFKDLAPMIAVKAGPESYNWKRRYGLDVAYERDYKRVIQGNTFARLTAEYPPTVVARAFDMTTPLVRQRVREQTAVTPGELSEYRRSTPGPALLKNTGAPDWWSL